MDEFNRLNRAEEKIRKLIYAKETNVQTKTDK